ncbi:hypothetical protein MRX96_010142 [Rhipicephalus microplus]
MQISATDGEEGTRETAKATEEEDVKQQAHKLWERAVPICMRLRQLRRQARSADVDLGIWETRRQSEEARKSRTVAHAQMARRALGRA